MFKTTKKWRKAREADSLAGSGKEAAMKGIPVSGGMSAPGSWTIIGVLYATGGAGAAYKLVDLSVLKIGS